MNAEEIKARLQKEGITYLLAQWVDINGTPRCKGVPVACSTSSSRAAPDSLARQRSAWDRGPTATT